MTVPQASIVPRSHLYLGFHRPGDQAADACRQTAPRVPLYLIPIGARSVISETRASGEAYRLVRNRSGNPPQTESRAHALICRAPPLFDATFVYNCNKIGERERFFLIVSHEHRRESQPLVKSAQPATQILAHLRVKGAERFVQQEHTRFYGERAGKRDALPLSAGQLTWVTTAKAVQLNKSKKLVNAATNLGTWRALPHRPHVETERDVLGNRHVLEQLLRQTVQATIKARGLSIRRRSPSRHQPLRHRDKPDAKALHMDCRPRQNHRRRQTWASSVAICSLDLGICAW